MPAASAPALKTIPVSRLGEVPVMGPAEIGQAVLKARTAQKSWTGLSFSQRAAFIMSTRRVIYDRLDDLASLISRENGKPLIEAISHDILPTMDLMTFFAKNAKKILKKQKIGLGKWGFMGHQSYLEFEPYGVIGVIAPWNFPFSIPLGATVMALMAGNTVVFKPSEYTPHIGLTIAQLFKEADMPQDVLQVITGDGMTGAALVGSGVDKIVFTGSVPTGKKIMAEAAKTLTPVNLELGGKDPMIVLKDADIDLASSAAVWGGFCNSGQVCASVERVYVHASIIEPFTKMVVEKTNRLKQGSGQDASVEMGPMIAEMQVAKVEEQVEEARAKGVKILTGGSRNRDAGPLYFKPTVMRGGDPSLSVIKEETFGPVLPIMPFKDEEEAIRMANDSAYGLNAYIWTQDIGHAQKLASRLEAGTVNINESVFTYALPQTPWGGPKHSSIGHTHGAIGLYELVKIRHVHINRMASKKNNFWWYEYSAEKLEMMRALCAVLFGRGWERVRGAFKFLGLMNKVKTM